MAKSYSMFGGAPVWFYSSDGQGGIDKVRIDRCTRPIDELLLLSYQRFLSESDNPSQAFVLAFPMGMLNPIPVLAYLAASTLKKDVLVLAREGRTTANLGIHEAHQRTYSMMAVGASGEIFVCYLVPSGLMEMNDFVCKPYLPRARIAKHEGVSWKNRYIDSIRERFRSGYCPKVLFSTSSDPRLISEAFAKIITTDKKINFGKIDVNVGVIILEAAERVIYSKDRYREFLQWATTIGGDDIKIFLHFSNPWAPVIDGIRAEGVPTMVFTPQFISLNSTVLSHELNQQSRTPASFCESIMMCDPSKFKSGPPIILEPHIAAELLYHHMNEIEQSLKLIDWPDSENTRPLIRKILSVTRNGMNLLVPPSSMGFWYKKNPQEYAEMHFFSQFLEDMRSLNGQVSADQKPYAIRLASEFKSLSNELESRQNLAFNAGGPPDKLALMLRHVTLNPESSFIIAYYVYEERDLIVQRIRQLKLDNRVRAIWIKALSESLDDRSEHSLLLPGPLKNLNLVELTKPYRSIAFASYDGAQLAEIEAQISSRMTANIDDQWRCLSSVQKANSLLDGAVQGTVDGLEKSFGELTRHIPVKTVTADGKPVSLETIIEEIKKAQIRGTQKDPLDRLEADLESMIEVDEIRESKPRHIMEFVARELKTGGATRNLKLDSEQAYLYRAPGSCDLKENFPREMQPHGLIVLVEDSDKKDVFSLIEEQFLEGRTFDKKLVESWRKRISQFIEETKIAMIDLYNGYFRLHTEMFGPEGDGPRQYQTVCTWARGEVIAPEDPRDLKVLGQLMGTPQLISNANLIVAEAEKIRNVHRQIGKRLNDIVKELEKGRGVVDLSYEEFLLRSKTNAYEILSVGSQEKPAA